MFHPPLLTRLVLLAVFVLTSLLGSFLPIHPRFHFRRWAVRASAASAGSLGIAVSIGTLVKGRVASWESVWLRLVVKDDPSWGGAREDGVTVGLVGFALLGVLTDWALERRFGPDPSQV